MNTLLFPPLTPSSRRILDRLPALIDKVFPLPRRFRSGLSRDVSELSRLLTADRKERGESYLGRPNLLSAYLRYFLPWNLYRLCRLLPALPLSLAAGDAVTDLGSGPLTLALALRICRPELRSVPLEFRCFDRTGTVLEAGKKLFAALCAEESGGVPWAVKTIKGEILRHGALSPMVRGKSAALTAAVNVYNEIFWDLSPMDAQGLARLAAGSGRLLSSLSDENGMILALEPGIPRSGEFITLLREALAAEGRRPLSPCPHQGPCPFPGTRQAKWCHFAFDTQDAPEALRRLSAAAGLPKDRAVTSFLLAGKPREAAAAAETAKTAIRIISDPFPTGGGFWGRYGCGAGGMVLVRGTKTAAAEAVSGTLGFYESAGKRDGKTGADVFNLTANTTGKGKSEE